MVAVLQRVARCSDRHDVQERLELVDLAIKAAQESGTPRDIAITVWSMARLAVVHSPLLQSISSQSLRTIAALEPEELSNTSWALAKLQCDNATLRQAISK